jgi:hypothetical protein
MGLILPLPEEGCGEEVFRDVGLGFTKLYLPSPSLNRPEASYSGLIPKAIILIRPGLLPVLL